MNYLAHFYLAYPEAELMFGNYIGDGVKGSDLSKYNDAIKRGIKFHRFIDFYTDSHELVHKAKAMFYPSQGKFAGVVTDVLFDFQLANNWHKFHKQALSNFSESCYITVAEFRHLMPLRSDRFYQYMVQNDILNNYRHALGIRNVFRGMDSRTSFDSNMIKAIDVMHENEIEFSRIFHDFFPQLISATAQWKKTN